MKKDYAFGNHLSDIDMSEDFVNFLYNLLLGKSSPHFDRYFEQIQKEINYFGEQNINWY